MPIYITENKNVFVFKKLEDDYTINPDTAKLFSWPFFNCLSSGLDVTYSSSAEHLDITIELAD